MMGSFVTRGLVMIFGYAYPAYGCFKTVEKNKPEIEQLRFWCQYWILVALLTVLERVGDTFISWLPMYSEAKLAFFIYLWFPKTKGTTYVYHSFFRPYIAKHEPHIDRNLLELKTRAGDIALLYFKMAATYAHTRVFDILQYVASQSTAPPPRHSQNHNYQRAETRNPAALAKIAPEADVTKQQIPQQLPELPDTSCIASAQKPQPSLSRTSSTSSTLQQPPAWTSSTGTSHQQPEPTIIAVGQVEAPGVATQASQTDAEGGIMIDKPAVSSSDGNTNPPPQETVMDEVIRVTRARLRRNRAVTKSS